MIRRIAAIVINDVRIRFRRPSTAILFLLLSACAYLWVPAPSTGRTLLEINGQRAIYNSAAVGMGTASLATIFIGLIGFYVISNALRRDVQTRCGFVHASTGMRGGEYLFGKFAGNLAFLFTFIAGFMGTSMVMQLVRGEAPLQPLLFAKQYVLLVVPGIVVVAAIAILFESIPWLSGRFGDVVYFFVWMASIGVVASMSDPKSGHPLGWIGIFDISGTGYLFESLRLTLHTNQVSIGSSTFDASKGVFLFGGLPASWKLVLPRIGTCLLAAPILGVASLFFHRFDPARVRVTEKAKRNWLGRINALAKPFARLMFALAPSGGRASRFDADDQRDADRVHRADRLQRPFARRAAEQSDRAVADRLRDDGHRDRRHRLPRSTRRYDCARSCRAAAPRTFRHLEARIIAADRLRILRRRDRPLCCLASRGACAARHRDRLRLRGRDDARRRQRESEIVHRRVPPLLVRGDE